MKEVTIGLVGSGFASHLHCNGYKKVYGLYVRLKTIVDIDIKKAKEVSQKYGFEKATTDFNELLNDDEIDVISICTPPVFHPNMIIKALEAGKHVICEKPLTGYFGKEEDMTPIGKEVSKVKMYETVIEEMDKIKKVIDNTNKKFMYAENYVYSTSIKKSAEIIKNKKSKILFMKGEESVRGSMSPVAGSWEKTGGGVLLRIGCHPLSGILYLKSVEGKARKENITIKSVVADTGVVSSKLSEKEKKYIAARPIDVEDLGIITITFSDESKALVIAADTLLGGTKNYVEIYCNDNTLMCNLTPTNVLNTYFLDEKGIEDVEISEMLPSKLGWNGVFVSDDVLRGYVGQFQDFMECIAEDREPLANFDLAYKSTKVLYAAYVSASEGKRVYL